MSPDLGRQLSIRAMVYVAGKPVPFFWPMRSFIHHNPLHGLEHLPFAEAVEKGAKLFHAHGFLPRRLYQEYLADGRLDADTVTAQFQAFAASREPLPGIDLAAWARVLLEHIPAPISRPGSLASAEEIHAALHGQPYERSADAPADLFIPKLHAALLGDRPIYESVDALYGTGIGDELDELVIRACLDFFDEGQAVWVMPNRAGSASSLPGARSPVIARNSCSARSRRLRPTLETA